jgi:hypothetical protein
VNEEAEDPSRPTGSRRFAEGDTAGAVTRPLGSPAGSSFSSSLGAKESPPAETVTDAGDAGRSGSDSSPGADASGWSPAEPPTDSASPTDQLAARASEVGTQLAKLSSERPEVVVGAAFVGGLLIATIIKRLAR